MCVMPSIFFWSVVICIPVFDGPFFYKSFFKHDVSHFTAWIAAILILRFDSNSQSCNLIIFQTVFDGAPIFYWNYGKVRFAKSYFGEIWFNRQNFRENATSLENTTPITVKSFNSAWQDKLFFDKMTWLYLACIRNIQIKTTNHKTQHRIPAFEVNVTSQGANIVKEGFSCWKFTTDKLVFL